jgi:glycosyltransferase involved in cell wall biosynthesis
VSLTRVVHLVEGLEIGGLERIVLTLVRHADPARRRPAILCTTRRGPLADEIEASGVAVHCLRLAGYYPPAILTAARALRHLAPHVLHCHGHFAGVLGRAAAWWAGVPVVLQHLHTAETGLRSRHLRLERLLARVTTRILCCSEAVRRHAREVLGLPADLLLTVPNGIDPPPCADRRAALAALGNPGTPIVGCVGSLAPHKGQETLIRAVGLLAGAIPSGTLVLVGDGAERPALERLSREAIGGWRAIFTGTRADARQLLPAFDVVAVPSVEREGFGLAALEAMDASVPVVASRIGGLPEVVEDGVTGMLCRPGEPASLAEALRRVLEHPDRGRALGAAGRHRVDALFRAATMARRVEAVYEEALGERRAA